MMIKKLISQIKDYILERPKLSPIVKFYVIALKNLNKCLYLMLKGKFSHPKRISSSIKWIKNNKHENKFLVYKNSIHINRNPPKTLGPICHEMKIAFKRKHIRATYLVKLKKGYVWGDNGAIIARDRTLLYDLSSLKQRLKPEEHIIFRKFPFPKLQKVDYDIGIVATDGGDSFYHWLYDVLPRLHVISDSNFSPYKLYINNQGKAYQKESLDILDVKKERLIKASNDLFIQAKNLIVPSVAGSYVHPWVIEFLKNKLRGSCKDLNYPEYVYVSREKALGRKILNEEQFCNLLNTFGFKRVFLEDLHLKEQFKIFYNSKLILGPHGAGFSNIFSCKPKTKIVEIFSPNYINACYYRIADVANLDYYYYIGNNTQSKQEFIEKPQKKTYIFRDNIRIDIAKFQKFLLEIVNLRPLN